MVGRPPGSPLFPYAPLFRSRRPHVGGCRCTVGAILEAEVRRHRDREQDADDHDDNEELDEGEAFLTSQPLAQTIHADFSLSIFWKVSHISHTSSAPQPLQVI